MTVADAVDLCRVRDDGIEHPKLLETMDDETNSVELADYFDWRDKTSRGCKMPPKIHRDQNPCRSAGKQDLRKHLGFCENGICVKPFCDVQDLESEALWGGNYLLFPGTIKQP